MDSRGPRTTHSPFAFVAVGFKSGPSLGPTTARDHLWPAANDGRLAAARCYAPAGPFGNFRSEAASMRICWPVM